MNNFFYNSSDFSLFKKALRETQNEPVVINILSTDPSLNENKSVEKRKVERKNFSTKFEPSPFGKFFGPRQQRTAPVDMSDFSSWKNKNYREAEQNIDKKTNNTQKFSIADFLNSTAKKEKYNDLDQAKSELQKPINQLSSSDPLYKKYSLDSYLNKLEEQTLVKDKFEKNDDILEPISNFATDVVPDSTQDENFGFHSDVDIEKVAYDEHLSGEKYSFDTSELDKIKTRLEKIEKENLNIKEKPTQKVLSSELSDLTKDDEDEFDLSKLSDESINEDDIDKLNKELGINDIVDEESKVDVPKVEGKKFVEINKTESPANKKKTSVKPQNVNQEQLYDTESEEEYDTTDESDEAHELVSDDELLKENDSSEEENAESKEQEINLNVDESNSNNDEQIVSTSEKLVEDDEANEFDEETVAAEGEIAQADDVSELYKENANLKRSDILTKDDFRTLTDEFMTKFAEMYKKEQPADQYGAAVYDDAQFAQTQQAQQPYDYSTYAEKQNEIQSKIIELIEQNKKTDSENEEKLKQAEIEKERIAREYENKLREVEDNYKKNYEAIKQKAYLEKLDSDMKLQQAESEFKRREQKIKEKEKAWSKKQKAGDMLRKELKSNISISDLEMEKKLLEVKTRKSRTKKSDVENFVEATNVIENNNNNVVEGENVNDEVVETEKHETVKQVTKRAKTASKSSTKTTSKSGSKSKTTSNTASSKTKRRTAVRGPKKRKIDSDIIGNIDFE